jgi:type II restriction enzyme
MQYFEQIRRLASKVSTELVDFSEPRSQARLPTQATTNFITNREQGDWAERIIQQAINKASKHYAAVKYGKSDDIVAGEEGWKGFYEAYQNELDEIGKRPDLLVFRKSDFDERLGLDISRCSPNVMSDCVRKAVAGVEVRSSAFLQGRYEAAMVERIRAYSTKALAIRDSLLGDYADLFLHPTRAKYLSILNNITSANLSITDFKCPAWGSNARLTQAREMFAELKDAIHKVQTRDYLSVTVKVEDLKVVYKWIETFNVPHYYFQVFFDKVFGISFKEILEIIADPDNEGEVFSVEKDVKNQNKTTIKINSNRCALIAGRVDEPLHKSVRRELERGRLLFYVTFEGGEAYIDLNRLESVLGI